MNTATFQPTIDWNTELLTSLLWVLERYIITAVCLVVVLVLLARFTEWGRRFWRVTGDYFTGPASLPVWALLAAILLLVIISVRISVLLSYYTNDLFTALQVAFGGEELGEASTRETGRQGFWAAMAVFAVLAVCYVVRGLLDLYLTQRFIMQWRIWLSRKFIGDWLGDYTYFRTQFSRHSVDNPDQRIQQDVDIFTTGVGGETNNPSFSSRYVLLFGAVEAVLAVFSFGAILWQLSGPLSVGGVTVAKALFWIVIVYVVAVTLVAFAIGKPLTHLSYLNEVRNAGLRYALVRMREASAAIGLYRGEHAEAALLNRRLDAVMGNYRRWLNRMMLFTGWNFSMSQAINPLPWIVQAQRLFAEQITFGDVWQSANAFGAIHDALSFFRNAYDQFASFRAAIIRLDGLAGEVAVNARAKASTRAVTVLPGTGEPGGTGSDGMQVEDLEVRTPHGAVLVRDLGLSLAPGETLLISGPSGIGKTVLLQSLAGLWPFASGRVGLPDGRDEAMFVPQLPYLPLGDLRAVVSYPTTAGTYADQDVQRALVKVALSHLAIHLGDVRDWSKSLSVGEQQRIAFARLLLRRPKAAFLDESTSALDEGLELMLYEVLRAELAETIVVSVSHRNTVERFHGHRLQLCGGGDWRLERLTPAV